MSGAEMGSALMRAPSRPKSVLIDSFQLVDDVVKNWFEDRAAVLGRARGAGQGHGESGPGDSGNRTRECRGGDGGGVRVEGVGQAGELALEVWG